MNDFTLYIVTPTLDTIKPFLNMFMFKPPAPKYARQVHYGPARFSYDVNAALGEPCHDGTLAISYIGRPWCEQFFFRGVARILERSGKYASVRDIPASPAGYVTLAGLYKGLRIPVARTITVTFTDEALAEAAVHYQRNKGW